MDDRDLWVIVAKNLEKIVERSPHKTKGEWSRAAGWKKQDRLSQYLSADPAHFRVLQRLQHAVEAAGGNPRDLFALEEVSVHDLPEHLRPPVESEPDHRADEPRAADDARGA